MNSPDIGWLALSPCPYPDSSRYPDGKCRCIVCSRCHDHTRNQTQGHYWAWCKVTNTIREFHFCCPDDCELESHADELPPGDEVPRPQG